MSDYLVGFNNIFDPALNNEIQDNLIEFLDWGLLEKGNYFNVDLGETSPDGYDYSRLHLSPNPHYSSGQAWSGFRSNWVWQSGLTPSGVTAPIVGTNNAIPGISGVYVDDTFYPSTTTGTYAHKVDYFEGRVIFDNPIPTGSKVQVEHSYKYINIVYANNVPWLREVQYDTLDRKVAINSLKDEYSVPSEMRLQLPAIAIEIVPKRTSQPYQLGGGQYFNTDVIFHCIAESASTRNSLVDMLSYQGDRSVRMFDTQLVVDNDAFPLNYEGIPNSGAKRYPDLISSYPGKMMYIKDLKTSDSLSVDSNLYICAVRYTMEIVKI